MGRVCKKCSKTVDDDRKFCPFCGNVLDEDLKLAMELDKMVKGQNTVKPMNTNKAEHGKQGHVSRGRYDDDEYIPPSSGRAEKSNYGAVLAVILVAVVCIVIYFAFIKK